MCSRPTSGLALGPISATLTAPSPGLGPEPRGRAIRSFAESALRSQPPSGNANATARGRGGGPSCADPVYQPHLPLHKAGPLSLRGISVTTRPAVWWVWGVEEP